MANALDSPVGEGARDEAQPVAPGAATVPEAGSPPGDATGLQPLALFLDAPLAADIAGLPPIQRPARLAELAESDPDPRRFVELGSALQLIGNTEAAATAYRAALRRDPGDVAAQAGLAMIEGAGGGGGLARATAGLARLARQNPQDQLVSFNQGIVEVYRARPARIAEAWIRTLQIDPNTYLGRAAVEGLNQLRQQAGGGTP